MKPKKIVLATMPSEGEFVNWTTPKYFRPDSVKYMPLGILSLATNLSGDNDICIIDASSKGYSIDETIDKIEGERPDVLGLSVPTRRVYAMNRILKETSAQYKAVGGPHATFYADQILEQGADAVFVGGLADLEFNQAVGEYPRGIVYCNTKINEIKFPRRSFLNIEDYFPKGDNLLFKADNRMPMFSSIGCPNRCFFCNVQSKGQQLKDAKTVLDEMEYLRDLGCKSVHVLDDNFNISRQHLEGILNEMDHRKWDTEWSGRGQVRMDLGLVERMKENRFKRIHAGIEALDDNVLRFFNKNINTDDIERFCEAMNKHGIDILGYFISGSPVETDEYKEMLPKKIKELGIKHAFFNILFPEPNTPYYDQLLKSGMYKKDHWAEYMKNPVPGYRIPYPYGQDKEDEVLKYNAELIREFKKEGNNTNGEGSKDSPSE